MNPILFSFLGLCTGGVFALLVTYDMIGVVGSGIGVGVLLCGAFIKSMYQSFFSASLLGFLVGFVVGGGAAIL